LIDAGLYSADDPFKQEDIMRVTFPMALLVTLGSATMPTAAQAGATVSNDGICAGFVPLSNGAEGPSLFTNESHTLLKGNGAMSVTCQFDIPAALIPAKTSRAQGFLCNILIAGAFQSTTDSRMLASSGGRGTLTCRVRT
jgi:hypothetical protein